MEEDADDELENLRGQFDVDLTSEKKATKELKGETNVQKKEMDRLKKEVADREAVIAELKVDKKNLFKNISLLEKKLMSLVKERKERDETIGIKERKIYDLKRKNQELEKFKFVLDYRIRELNRKSEPRDQELSLLKERLQEMDGELERGHRTNSQLTLSLQDQKLKVDTLNAELKDVRKDLGDVQQLLTRFRLDLADAMEHMHDPRAFKDAVRKVHAKYVSGENARSTIDADFMAENLRQKRSVQSLSKKLEKDQELHRADNSRILEENIGELRRELRTVKEAKRRADLELTTRKKTHKAGSLTQSTTRMSRSMFYHETERLKSDVVGSPGHSFPPEATRMIEAYKEEVTALKERIEELTEQLKAITGINDDEDVPPQPDVAEVQQTQKSLESMSLEQAELMSQPVSSGNQSS